MKESYITMSEQELNRIKVIDMLIQKQIKQSDAAKILGLSIRQIKRLKKSYLQEGDVALISKRRGKASNHYLPDLLKQKALTLIKSHYSDFGPTLACEKLTEVHDLQLSVETTRKWMIAEGIWQGKMRKKARVHQSRARRPCFGELVQMDGSPHDWFEGRGARCCLLVLIDDATSQLLNLRFEPVESGFGYFRLLRTYFKRHGRPLSLYTDKHGIFRVNISEAKSGTGNTQFGRAMQHLGIELICANTPQAKGRVERANGVLQDRLVKELRLEGISDIDVANNFLPRFIEDYNKRFSVAAESPLNAHWKGMPTDEALELIFSLHYSRKLSKNLELSFNNTIYQIKTATEGYAMRGASITVCVDEKNEITLIYKNRILDYAIHKKRKKPASVIDAKAINPTVSTLKIDGRTNGYPPKKGHPWKQYEQVASRKAAARKKAVPYKSACD